MKFKNALQAPFVLIKNSIRIFMFFLAPVIAGINRYVDKIDINEEVRKFPVHSASNEEFNHFKDKVIQVIDVYKRDGQATLSISANEMNAVNVSVQRGNFLSRNPNYFHPPLFYTFEKEQILEQIMSVPGLYRYGYLHVTIAINYTIKDGNIFEQQQLLESYGKRVEVNDSPKVDIVPLERSKLIISIFKPIVDRSEIMQLIHSIQHLYIQDDLLQIQFASSSAEVEVL